jgi:hypothetical protein
LSLVFLFCSFAFGSHVLREAKLVEKGMLGGVDGFRSIDALESEKV